MTSLVFAQTVAVDRYLGTLLEPRPDVRATAAPYYARRNYARLIRSGKMALGNAVAYRSKSISGERQNRRLAEKLPSTQVHRKWLREELLTEAARGERLVIAHRTGLWKLLKREQPPG